MVVRKPCWLHGLAHAHLGERRTLSIWLRWHRPAVDQALNHDTMKMHAPAVSAETGIVSTQTHTTRLATLQRTADRRRVGPTPTMAPEMVWVVLTGMPNMVFSASVVAPAVSAANPPTG